MSESLAKGTRQTEGGCGVRGEAASNAVVDATVRVRLGGLHMVRTHHLQTRDAL